MKSLNKLILLVAALVSLLLVTGIYLLFSGFGDRMMQKAAFSQSQMVARLTFANMFQLMNQGWNRDQVIAFARSATDSLANSPLTIEFYRGPLVNDLHGFIAQPEPGEDLAQALRTGRARELATPQGGRYIYPLVAEDRCLGCHGNVKRGDVLGAITVQAKYDQFIDDSRKLLMLVLLLLAPTPFIAAWLVTLYLDSRVNRFVAQLDRVIEQAEAPGGRADFSQVKPSWHELDEILARIKRLAAR